jgi:hypothetical protein
VGRTLGVLGVRAAELEHEVLDDTVEVDAVVELVLDKRKEVSCNGHSVRVGMQSGQGLTAQSCYIRDTFHGICNLHAS